MTDIRELLDRGADVAVGLPDVVRARREAAVRRRRRLTAGVGLAAAMVVVAGAGAATLRPDAGPPVSERPSHTVPAPGGELVVGREYSAGPVGLPWLLTAPRAGWQVVAREDGWVSLHRGEQRVNLQRWTAVVDPGSDPSTPADEQPLPADLLAWITTHPRLDVTGTTDVVVAGDPWVAVDVTVERPLRFTPAECAGRPCVLLGLVGAEPVEVLASETARIYLPRSGVAGPIVVTAVPAGADLTRVEALIASLRKD